MKPTALFDPIQPHPTEPTMDIRPALALIVFMTAPAFADDRPPIPAGPIAEKKELLFSDDFESAAPAKVWHKVVPTFVVEHGSLKGTQTRDKNIPAAEGKPAVTAHAAVHGLEIPTKDSVVEVKIRFEGASMIDVEFDDRQYKGAHYGHIARADPPQRRDPHRRTRRRHAE